MSEEKSSEQTMQELQINEHQHQQMMMEKQTMQIELNEVMNALNEVKKSKDDVFRVMGNIMIKADAAVLIKELDEKKKIVEMRINSIEKQEAIVEKRVEQLREKLNASVSKER